MYAQGFIWQKKFMGGGGTSEVHVHCMLDEWSTLVAEGGGCRKLKRTCKLILAFLKRI